MGSPARTLAILLALVGGMSGGCSLPHESALVEKQVTQFHALLDAGRGSEIYAGASPDFRNARPESQVVAYFDGVHRKLGTVQKTEVQNWVLNNGKFFVLTYKTQYSEGEATEYFVYRFTNGMPLLVSYNINSDVLVTK
jgi:uncharacterized protein DUF4019